MTPPPSIQSVPWPPGLYRVSPPFWCISTSPSTGTVVLLFTFFRPNKLIPSPGPLHLLLFFSKERFCRQPPSGLLPPFIQASVQWSPPLRGLRAHPLASTYNDAPLPLPLPPSFIFHLTSYHQFKVLVSICLSNQNPSFTRSFSHSLL